MESTVKITVLNRKGQRRVSEDDVVREMNKIMLSASHFNAARDQICHDVAGSLGGKFEQGHVVDGVDELLFNFVGVQSDALFAGCDDDE